MGVVEQQQAPSGALVGYARVSTDEQNPERQHHALRAAGCTRIYTDRLSGRDTDRPELGKCLDYLREGDQLVVTEFSRLSRSVRDLTSIVDDLHARGIQFRSLQEQIDTSSATGELVFHVIGSINQFIRRLIVEGTNEGLAAARREGKQLGRPPKLDAAGIERARAKLAEAGATVENVARGLGVSKLTLYRHVPGLREGGIRLVREQVQQGAMAAYQAAQSPAPASSTDEPARTEHTRATSDTRARRATREPATPGQETSSGPVLAVVPDTPDPGPQPAEDQHTAPADKPEPAEAAPSTTARSADAVRAVGVHELVDVNATTLTRNADTGTYSVTASTVAGGELVFVGLLDRDPRKSSSWQARSPAGVNLGGTHRTRQQALLRLLEPHYED